MPVKLIQNAEICSEKTLSSEKHILFIMSEEVPTNLPFVDNLQAKLNRMGSEYHDLNKTPVAVDLPNNSLACFVLLKENLSFFQRHSLLRKAIKPLLDEHATELAICVFGN
jgi:leucyl aminopeptidase